MVFLNIDEFISFSIESLKKENEKGVFELPNSIPKYEDVSLILPKRKMSFSVGIEMAKDKKTFTQIEIAKIKAKFDFDTQTYFWEYYTETFYSRAQILPKQEPKRKDFIVKFVEILNFENQNFDRVRQYVLLDIEFLQFLERKLLTIDITPSVLKEPKPKVIDEYKRIFDRYNWHTKHDKMKEPIAKEKTMEHFKIKKTKFHYAIKFCKSLKIN